MLAAARRGEGRCLVVEGEAGLGKSRLAAAACEAADGMTVLRARGSDLERDFSFGVVLQLFAPLAGRPELLTGAAALSAPLFAAGQAGSEFPLLHGLHWLAANAAEQRPLLLAVDDAHWADEPSLQFLLYLLQRLDELPVAVVVTTRPPEARLVRRIARHRHTAVAALRPLSAGAVARIVQAELGGDDELAAACAAATAGNPFYLRELVAALRADGRMVVAEPVAQAVVGRVAALPGPAAELASAVAVLGDGASLERAAALAGVDADAAAGAADALAGAAVLERGVPLAFVHPLVREAVYTDLPEARRARAHARAAELLRDAGADAEQVASHLVHAHGAAGEWAVGALRQAAQRALERGTPAAAARYLRQAVAALEREEERGALLTELALAEARAREEGAADRAREAIEATAGARERARVALEVGMALVDGSHPQAGAVFDLGLAALGDPRDASAATTAADRVAAAPAAAGDELAMTLRSARAAIAFDHATRAPGDLDALLVRAASGAATPGERLMLAHGALAPALRGESIDELRRLARAALSGPQPDVTSPTEMGAWSLAATALLMAGELDEAERALTPALASARERGSVLAFGTLSHVRAHALHRRGRLEDAIADAQSALDAVRYGWGPELPGIHAVLALCLLERGELDAAEAALAVPGGEERWGATFTWADLLEARGRLKLARGDAPGALEELLACGARLEPLDASHPGVVAWRSGAAEAALALGDAERAAELAAADLELARGFGAAREIGLALRTAGVVAGGDRGTALLRESVTVLRGSEAELELAHALCALGGALLAERHRLAAREALTEALDLAHRSRADALEDLARERLVAAGARPRRASARGSDALTPRERRIAQMAAAGLGNREIAEALFITMKTVETHLGRAYRKLGVTGRSGLRDALAD